MNLEDLNKIKSESDGHKSSCNNFIDAERLISRLRKSDSTLCDITVRDIHARDYGHHATAKIAFYEVLNEQKHELLRLVELRLCAAAREQKIKAAQKSCIVTASILPIEFGE